MWFQARIPGFTQADKKRSWVYPLSQKLPAEAFLERSASPVRDSPDEQQSSVEEMTLANGDQNVGVRSTALRSASALDVRRSSATSTVTADA
jgi:hypothetical protein